MDLSVSEAAVSDLAPRARGNTERTNPPPRYTHEQTEALNALFKKGHEPSIETKRIVAEEIGLIGKQVNVR
jgi:hypothetical protein